MLLTNKETKLIRISKKESENLIDSILFCAKLPTMHLVYKAKSVPKWSYKNSLRDNSALSSQWEVFFKKGVSFFPGEDVCMFLKNWLNDQLSCEFSVTCNP